MVQAIISLFSSIVSSSWLQVRNFIPVGIGSFLQLCNCTLEALPLLRNTRLVCVKGEGGDREQSRNRREAKRGGVR